MEEMIYDVLCEIRDELSGIRIDLDEVKCELQSIRGVGEYSKDLDDVCSRLENIETAIGYLE